MTSLERLKPLVEDAFERRSEITPKTIDAQLKSALEECIGLLDSGKARVAEKREGKWVVNEWLKKAVLLYFRANDNAVIYAVL
jgi:2,3,4,5-tetrahydropyridine-2,6-dicarboxylate N-succinyltransferase